MNKAIIIGVFEFLGFHFCKKILNEGIEVEGIHIETALPDVEEKELEIGRNANFSIITEESLDKKKSSDGEAFVLLDFYDFFIRKQEDRMFESSFLPLILQRQHLVIFLPTVLLTDKFLLERKKINEYLHSLQHSGMTIQSFYFPAIFGPGQPEEFMFQKAIHNGSIDMAFHEREPQEDAIYIDDIVEAVFPELEKKNESYLYMNQMKNAWGTCAELVKIPCMKDEKESFSFTGVRKRVESQLSIEQGIERQRFVAARNKSSPPE